MTGRWCVGGGAGFLGSHFAIRLLVDPSVDNFSSGREWHLAEIADDPRLKIVRGDGKALETITDRIKALGWRCHRSSAQALRASMCAMADDHVAGRI